MRCFDAARSYGRAEQFLSGWLRSRDLAPEDVTVGSKWGYTYRLRVAEPGRSCQSARLVNSLDATAVSSQMIMLPKRLDWVRR